MATAKYFLRLLFHGFDHDPAPGETGALFLLRLCVGYSAFVLVVLVAQEVWRLLR